MENEIIIERITAAEQAVKSTQHQIDEMKDLINSIHELASELKHMRTDINKMQADIDTMKAKPTKRYELLVTTVLTALTGGFVGFILSQLF